MIHPWSEADTEAGHERNEEDNGSEAGSDKSARTELLTTAAATLRLSTRPGGNIIYF